MSMMGRLGNARTHITTVLDGALSLLLAVTCVVLLYKMLTPARATPPPKPATFATGDRIPAVDGLQPGRAEVTLLLVLREDCKFCEASIPFYRQLASATSAQRTSGKLQILLLTGADKDTGKSYLLRKQLSLDGVVSIPKERRSEFKIAGTPTVLQVNHSGVLTGVWEGQLPKAVEDQLLKSLLALP